MQLFDGRPEVVDGRLPREIRTYDFLDKLGIEYKRTDHEPKFYLLMMPGDKKFKTKELSSQINSARLSFAEAEDMLKYLDIEPGAVSIMGLMNDKDHEVQLLIDEDVLKGDYVGCHPCVCTSSLKIKTSDVMEKFLPAVGHDVMTVHLVGED